MIYIVDDFFATEQYESLKEILPPTDFTEHVVGGKSFHIKESTREIDRTVLDKIERLEGRNVKNILSFFRIATDTLDTDWRIHSDQKINGQQPDRAVVLFMSECPHEELNGTAFWEHETYGHTLPLTSNEEFDRVLKEDSEDTSKWKLNSVVGHKENRLVSYPASYFHSKYPNKAWKEGRIVYVMFYGKE